MQKIDLLDGRVLWGAGIAIVSMQDWYRDEGPEIGNPRRSAVHLRFPWNVAQHVRRSLEKVYPVDGGSGCLRSDPSRLIRSQPDDLFLWELCVAGSQICRRLLCSDAAGILLRGALSRLSRVQKRPRRSKNIGRIDDANRSRKAWPGSLPYLGSSLVLAHCFDTGPCASDQARGAVVLRFKNRLKVEEEYLK